MHEDSPTLSPRKRRRQAYSQLIRLFLQNTRDRLETIRGVIKDESDLHFHLTHPSDESYGNQASVAKIRLPNENSDDENRQFIDFAFADTTNADQSTSKENIANANEDNTQEYLNSLFAAVGYSRITTTTSNPIERDEKSRVNIISRYLINPVLSVWNATRERFNLNNESDISSFNDNSTVFRVNFFDNRTIKPKLHTNSRNVTNNEPNENRADNFNYSLPLIQRRAMNNVTSVLPTSETMPEVDNANKVNVSEIMLDVEYIGDDHSGSGSDKKTRNTSSTSTEDAAAVAFRMAFLRYSNAMQHSLEYAKRNTSHAQMSSKNSPFTQNNPNEMKSNKLLDGTLLSSNLFDANSSHIQMVPNKKEKTNGNGSMSESAIIANEVDDSFVSSSKSFGEKAGILILEVFGTIIGVTWQAINGIPNYFQHSEAMKVDA